MRVHSINLRNKLYSAKDVFAHLFHGRLLEFFCELSQYFPTGLCRFRAANVMFTTSPGMIFRNYKTYNITRANESDIEAISRFTGTSLKLLVKRFSYGDYCYLAKNIINNNSIVNVIWGHRGACFINGLGLDLDIDNDSMYLYGAYTSPEARMKGLYTSTMKELFDVYMSQGISKIFGIVEQTNPYSYNIHLKLKFKPIGKVIFITLAMFKLSIYYNIENDKRTARFYISSPQNKMLI